MSLRDELLKLGRQRGYLIEDEIEKMLPDDPSPDDIQEILAWLEDNGLELRDDDLDSEPRCFG